MLDVNYRVNPALITPPPPVFAPLVDVRADAFRCSGYIPERSSLHDRLLGFNARIEQWVANGVHAVVEGMPLSISTVAWYHRTSFSDSQYLRGAARTPVAVPDGVALTVSARGLLDVRSWLTLLTLVAECEVDVPLVAQRLVVTGDPELARTALRPGAVEALLAMREIMRELTIADGVLTVSWQSGTVDEHSLLPTAVVDVLREMSRALAGARADR